MEITAKTAGVSLRSFAAPCSSNLIITLILSGFMKGQHLISV